MNDQPRDNGNVASPVFVEDLFLTDVFLIKGRLPNKQKRLTNLLEDFARAFLPVHDATLVSLRTRDVIRTPTVMVNVSEIILAHELVDVAGDETLRRLAGSTEKKAKIRAFYNGASQFEIAGQIEPGAYEYQPLGNRRFFIMQKPSLRGLDLQHQELQLLKSLDYAILKKDRMAYVYDFG